ncbi:MAG: recombinational DNA repair protein (RecE pathway), partial [Clostridiaceae bacterium]|nr:recombinational DNA repair protein (RecE pathway) [Clostridiaceae bacterium]
MTTTQNQAAMTSQKSNEVAKTQQLAMSERFTNQVLREFGSNVAGAIQVTDYQRQLIQGYFIGIDRALKMAEEARIRKNENNRDHKYDNNLPVTWANTNLNDLALDVVHYARMGLDMMQDNHLSPIPYKNNKANKYDITLMPGYNGIQYIAEKYAVEKPLAVTIELVYSTDTFKPIKKSRDNKVESYEFEINNAFDRGTVVGGFGYIEYTDPLRNKLIIMTLKDIEKRKPAYAAA